MPQIPLRRRILRLAQGSLYWSGLLGCLPTRGNALILMYHSVSSEEEAPYIDPAWTMRVEDFEKQVQFLARHRKVAPLQELVDRLKSGRDPEPGTVVITFDDGYRDNLYHAAPILRRYGLPAMIALATDYITHGRNQLIDTLYSVFKFRTRNQLTIHPHEKQQPITLNLSVPSQRRLAYQACDELLITSNHASRKELLADVETQLKPDRRPPRLTLTWQEVRELHTMYPEIEIGVHTALHLDLSKESVHTIASELRTCCDDVVREVGVSPRHFVFPYGRPTELARSAFREFGFNSAIGASGPFLVDANSDLYSLPRTDARTSDTQIRLRSHPSFSTLPGRLRR